MEVWFGRSIVQTGRLPLFCFFVSFLIAFLFIHFSVPGSPWARRRYPCGSARPARARRREERVHRPLVRMRNRLSDLIAGRPDGLGP
jgi:hypothetical protein